MKDKKQKNKVALIRNILLIVLIIILAVIIYVLFKTDMNRGLINEELDSNRYYSKEKSDGSNVEIIVSNQSFVNPKVRLTCLIDETEVFDEVFKVGDQHVVSYYYLNLDSGKHVLEITSEDDVVESYEFEVEQNKKYFYITYWGKKDTGSIKVFESDDPIGLD